MSEDVRKIPICEIFVVNPRHRDQKKFEVIVQSIKDVGLGVAREIVDGFEFSWKTFQVAEDVGHVLLDFNEHFFEAWPGE